MVQKPFLSLPVRGAWVEIYLNKEREQHAIGRSPCGERGLKSIPTDVFCSFVGSLPVRGAWVEIVICLLLRSASKCRSPCGERGLKYGHSYITSS